MKYIELECLEEPYVQDVWQLLKNADHEFIPSLSGRNSTCQKELAAVHKMNPDGPAEYFDQMKTQRFILALDGRKAVGFMTYIHKQKVELQGEELPVLADYISTIIVDPAYRRRGITRQMYHILLQKESGLPLITRTWSLNHSHISILESLGFSLLERRENDRGAGIDTVYYGRNRAGRNRG